MVVFSACCRPSGRKKRMKQTEYARKIDTTGRVIIPSHLREQLDLRTGDIVDFYIHEEGGRTFLAIECPRVVDKIE